MYRSSVITERGNVQILVASFKEKLTSWKRQQSNDYDRVLFGRKKVGGNLHFGRKGTLRKPPQPHEVGFSQPVIGCGA